MRAAIHLHLFYPDVAIELIGRVAALGRADIDVLATFAGALPAEVDRALDTIPGRVIRIETPNRGWDIGPLFTLLPRIAAEGYAAIAHLHTKKGDSGYAAEWRVLAYEGLIGDDAGVSALLAAFADDPALMLAGPAALYKSAASHQFGNADLLATLAPRLMAPLYPLADWGFFAGTFFWARPALLERVAALIRFDGHEWERDGTLAHAAERLIGLAAVALNGAVGLVDAEGALAITPAPGEPSHEPIIRTLVDRAERFVAPLDAGLAALIGERNPLADYLRHGREEGALDPNPYFSTSFYNRIHADVAAAGIHPLEHYAQHGAAEGRATGPLFDGKYYRQSYADVAGDPLRHFLEVGAGEGRVAIPISQPEHDGEGEGPRRFYRHFDGAEEARFLRGIAEAPADVAERAADMLVSVIMPVWNRADTVAAAIRSVLAQTHARFELIIADDGSSDGTQAAVAPFLTDTRVRWMAGARGGVSAARNRGLAAATGALIAYLDSDNRWMPWFLEVMTRFMAREGARAAYSAIALRDELGHLTGYRGAPYDQAACLDQNYVDLNAFVHDAALIDRVGGFDPALRRMVDWDLILRIGAAVPIGYAPFVGCDYHDGKTDAARITTAEPAAFQKLVQTKHATGHAIGTAEFAAALQLSFAIKIAAPADEREIWGDWHFAEALAAAIRRLGHVAHVDLRGAWSGRALAEEDVAISLRGLIAYAPRPGQYAVMWNISHPDQVGYDEYDRYRRVYVASESYAALLEHLTTAAVAPLLQATDPARFHPAEDAARGAAVLFVGNSRGVERDVVRWAIAAGRPPAIHGGGWSGLVPPALVAAEHADNATLGPLYAGAGAVLNDHWPSMAAFGLLSNRLFDAVAAGARVISDPVPSIARTFGDAVTQVDGPAALARALDRPITREARCAAAERVIAEHSFDVRARTIVGDVLADLGIAAPFERPPPAPATPLRVHLVVSYGAQGPQSSAYIRLLCPLTDESVSGRAAVTLGSAEDPVPECDVCIVQRAALPTIGAADALVRRLGTIGAALVVDVDDAFAAMDDHPEAERYRPLNTVIERAIAASAETWFSTPELQRLYAPVAHRHAVLPNMLDPRIWRDWRRAPPAPFTGDRVRMLYMGTGTHGPDLAAIRPALDQLWEEREGQWELTLIGIAADVPPAPWLRRLAPPADAIAYHRFVRWLRAQGPFDVGLAPLADSAFNRAKSDIKLLDYAALGLLPVVAEGPAYARDPAAAAIALHAGDWYETLRGVIDDRDAARARAAGAEAYVWERRSVARIAGTMIDRLEALR